MILPNLYLKGFSNQYREYSGLDTLDECWDKEHFLKYPYKVEYQYNSRGFRGPEWPSNLDDICWCVGDSFTAGLGIPYHHTWHQVLSNKLKINTINISMDGASNSWITRKTIDLLKIKPKNIIIQWSYIHRRESTDSALLDEIRRIYAINTTNEQDTQHMIDCVNAVESVKENTNIIHTFIPGCFPNGDIDEEIIKMNINIVLFHQIDRARDGHHYDVKTADLLTNNIVNSGFLSI